MDSGLDWRVGAGRGVAAGLIGAIGRLDAISSDALTAKRERQKKLFGSAHLRPLPGDVSRELRTARAAESFVALQNAGNYGARERERQFEVVRKTAVGLRKTTVAGQVSVLNRAKMER